MNHNPTIRTAAAFVVFLVIDVATPPGSQCNGQQPEATMGEIVHAFCDKEANRYQIGKRGSSEKLARLPESILRWSAATNHPVFGDNYLWTEKGCARAMVSIFAIGPPRNLIAAECQSLSESALEMRRDGEVVWSPADKGLEFKRVPEFAAAADTPVARGIQMNRISRMFSANFSPHTAPDEITNLRLLARPLYRYESQIPTIVDGAVYAFVHSTDPEALLVLEARKTEGEVRWFYAPARARHDPIRLQFKQQLVWDVPRLAPPWDNIRKPDGTYFNLNLNKIADDQWLRDLAPR